MQGGITRIAAHGRSHRSAQETRLVIGGELGDAGILEGDVSADAPVPVGSFHGDYVQGEFNTLVNQVSDVLDENVGKVLAQRHGGTVEQVEGVAVVHVHTGSDAVAPQTQVQTDVPGFSGLPLDILVERLGSQHVHIGTTHVITHFLRGGASIEFLIRIIVATDILLTGASPAQTEFEGAYGIHILEEVLILDVPGESGRREETPLIALGETGRAVSADRCGEQILGSDGIIHAAEEGHENISLGFVIGVQLDKVLCKITDGSIQVLLTIVIHIVALPGITSHHIQVGMLEIMIVVGIGFQEGVDVDVLALVGLVRTLILGGMVGAQNAVIVIVVAGHVITQIHIEAQVFETMHAVIQLEVSQGTQGVVVIDIVVNVGIRVAARHGVGLSAGIPIEVFSISVINRLGGIERQGRANGAGSRPVGGLENTLDIGVHGKVIVKELG